MNNLNSSAVEHCLGFIGVDFILGTITLPVLVLALVLVLRFDESLGRWIYDRTRRRYLEAYRKLSESEKQAFQKSVEGYDDLQDLQPDERYFQHHWRVRS